MTSLKIFQGIEIPADLAPIQKYVALGSSDSGKTYLLAKIAEQCADAGIFFVILDPVGKHWSLRAGPDGKSKGGKADVWVIGGLHGDVPLDPASGELIADTVLDHPGRYVLDVSLFETDAEVHRFADAFARRLFRRKMRDPGWPMLLMIEEAESFLPQNVMKGQEKMKNAFGRIVRQGRNHGLGVFLVFQRSAAGDKGAISQCKILIAKRTSHNLDQDAIDNWVKANGTPAQRAEMMGALASMDVDEAYVWDPTWLKVFKRTRVLKRVTFDSSANVKHGEKMPSVQLTPLDVGALGEAMKRIADDAKANDPSELKKDVEAYQKELSEIAGYLGIPENHWPGRENWQWGIVGSKARVALLAPAQETKVEQVQVPALNEGELESVEASLVELDRVREQLDLAVTQVSGTIGELGSTIELAKTLRGELAAREPVIVAPPSPRDVPRRVALRSRPPATTLMENGEISTGASELLAMYAAFSPEPVPPERMGVLLAKSSNSGPFRKALRQLWDAGYVDDDYRVTSAGSDLFDQQPPRPTATEVQVRWRGRLKGDNALMQQVFEVVLKHAPQSLTPDQIGLEIGKSPNSGPVRKAFKQLNSLQVCVYDRANGGLIVASPYLLQP